MFTLWYCVRIKRIAFCLSWLWCNCVGNVLMFSEREGNGLGHFVLTITGLKLTGLQGLGCCLWGGALS